MCAATPNGRDAEKRPEDESCSVEAGVRLRIEEALGHESFRRMGAELHLSAETIRRQMRGDAGVSLRVLAAVCARTGVSADWLLFGTGPRTDAERVDHALRAAPLRALIAALADRVPLPAAQVEAAGRPEGRRADDPAAPALAHPGSPHGVANGARPPSA